MRRKNNTSALKDTFSFLVLSGHLLLPKAGFHHLFFIGERGMALLLFPIFLQGITDQLQPP